ncbi:MAG: hypothetical protein AAGC57_19955 [Pseudomonadota bacterium]
MAQATQAGTAEATAQLLSPAGEAPFRVSLWRQRGGERIRLLGAFAAIGASVADAADPAPPPITAQEALAAGLDAPLGALMAAAARLRDGAEEMSARDMSGLAGDVMAAGWRLTRLSEALQFGAEGGALAGAMAEIDLGRFLRRFLRLAHLALEDTDVELRPVGTVPDPGAGPVLAADEGLLWSALDLLLLDVAARGRGPLGLGLDHSERGGVAIILSTGSGSDLPGTLSLGRARRLLGPIGGTVEIDAKAGGQITLRFPRRRVLDPD